MKNLADAIRCLVVLHEVHTDQGDQLPLHVHLPRAQGYAQGGARDTVRQLRLPWLFFGRLSDDGWITQRTSDIKNTTHMALCMMSVVHEIWEGQSGKSWGRKERLTLSYTQNIRYPQGFGNGTAAFQVETDRHTKIRALRERQTDSEKEIVKNPVRFVRPVCPS